MADKQEITADDYASMVYQDGESLVVDLGNVQEMKFENIPKGIYNAEVDQLDFVKESQTSGAPMFEFTFRITEGDFTNRKLKYWTSFSSKALPGTKTSLLRIDPDLFNTPFKPEDVAAQGVLLGKPVKIKVDMQDYQGQERNKIAYLLPPGGNSGGAKGGEGFFGGKAT